MAHLAPNATSVSLMSRILKFDRRQLVALQQNLTHIAARDGDPWIASFEEYEEAVDEVGIAANPDKEVLDRIFTLMDRIGYKRVDIREYMSALAVFIIGDKHERIQFACQLYDTFDNKRLKRNEVVALLLSMNTVCDVFGDVALEEKQIRTVADDAFKESGVEYAGNVTLEYEEHSVSISQHEIMEHFLPEPEPNEEQNGVVK